MASIFSRIVSGELPCYKIAETAKFLAFLDITPLAEGHTLVIPKAEVDYFFDLDNTDYAELLMFAKEIACALKKSIPCRKVGMTVIGLEVPHAHIHLVPLNKMDDINFSRAKTSISPERLAEIAELIKAALPWK
jgi:histidine triad (HIT) family protein